MKTKFFCAIAIFCALGAIAVARAEGDDSGQGGGHHGSQPGGRDAAVVDFILKHAQDLSITPDQNTKLQALQADIKKQLDTLKANPNYQDMQTKMKSAMQTAKSAGNFNSDDVKNLRQQIKDLTAKDAPLVSQARQNAEALLTPDQVTKLEALLKAQQGQHKQHGGGAATGGGNAPGGEQ